MRSTCNGPIISTFDEKISFWSECFYRRHLLSLIDMEMGLRPVRFVPLFDFMMVLVVKVMRIKWDSVQILLTLSHVK